MPQKLNTRGTPTRHIVRATTGALVLTLGFTACACASLPNPCGPPPTNGHAGAFRDPYTQRRQFERSVAEYRVAATGSENPDNLRDAVWKVCIDAQGLAPFTREVASDIRPRFSRALNTLVLRTQMNALISEPAADGTEDGVTRAAAEFLSAMPRFWFSPAASLRGSRQPGSPLHSHY